MGVMISNMGDQDRVEEVYRSLHPRLRRSLFAYTGDAELASDADAEAFAQGAGDRAAVAAIERPLRSATCVRVEPSPMSAAMSDAATTVTCDVHERTMSARWSAPGAASMTTTGWSRCSQPSQNGAVEHRLAPKVGETVDRWEFVRHAGGSPNRSTWR